MLSPARLRLWRVLPRCLLLLLTPLGCHPPTPRPSPPACHLPPPSAQIEQTAQELHQVWDLPADPVYFAPVREPGPALRAYQQAVRARLDDGASPGGGTDPLALLRRQRAVFLAATTPGLRAEAAISGPIIEGRVGQITPPSCLDALLVDFQASRHPMITQPSELAAFILRRPAQGGDGERLRVYVSSLARSGGRMSAAVRERVDADLRAGFVLLAHLHNHPFLFDRVIGDASWTTAETQADIAGAIAPSASDVQYYGSLIEDAGLKTARVTNGFHTLTLRPDEIATLSPH